MLARPQDSDLNVWAKVGVLLKGKPPLQSPTLNFRDPSEVFSGTFVAVGGEGCVFVYKAEDNIGKLTYHSILYESSQYGVLECPDVFDAAGNLMFFKFSSDRLRRDFYMTGKWNGTAFVPATDPRPLDLGSCAYASKSFWDANQQRVYWSWLTEERTAAMPPLDWAGVMALPRVVTVNADATATFSLHGDVQVMICC